MNINSKYKVDATFSMSSMTDIVFLLLIFFMLTSSFITPSGLPVNLPTSKSSAIVMQKVSVTITKELGYYVDEQLISKDQLEGILRNSFNGEEGSVVLHCDKTVPVEDLVYVASIATMLEAKVSIATKPNL
ncbi:MAG: ExbD/TolR family protein [Cytophagales bacterium]|jgi:biopolymer transport protein ExbD|nr:MAG: biopolymer transporter ExbD [Flammeovirgaceae bacterium TMED32]|tara:strand:- start:2135 stop:2527 length:393 start_codon:yes stop_codon:yes gene_type:complete